MPGGELRPTPLHAALVRPCEVERRKPLRTWLPLQFTLHPSPPSLDWQLRSFPPIAYHASLLTVVPLPKATLGPTSTLSPPSGPTGTDLNPLVSPCPRLRPLADRTQRTTGERRRSRRCRRSRPTTFPRHRPRQRRRSSPSRTLAHRPRPRRASRRPLDRSTTTCRPSSDPRLSCDGT